MTDLRERVERARVGARLSQAQLAGILKVTQGHYSKVAGGRVPLSARLRDEMADWLDGQKAPLAQENAAWRMQELAASIRRDCMALMHLAEAAERSAISPPE